MRVAIYPSFLNVAEITGVAKNNYVVNSLLFIKQGPIFYKVRLDDITHIESDNVYIHVHLVNNKFLVRSTIDQYLDILGSKQFFRVHRSFAININHVQYIDINHIAVNNNMIPMGKTYKNELLNSLRLG